MLITENDTSAQKKVTLDLEISSYHKLIDLEGLGM